MVVGVPSSQIEVVVKYSVMTVELGMTTTPGVVSSSQSVVVVDSSSLSSVGTALGVSVTITVTSTVVVETTAGGG